MRIIRNTKIEKNELLTVEAGGTLVLKWLKCFPEEKKRTELLQSKNHFPWCFHFLKM
jgi:hypothetical protein